MQRLIITLVLLAAVVVMGQPRKIVYTGDKGWQDSFVYAADNNTKIPLATRFRVDVDSQDLIITCDMALSPGNTLASLPKGKRGAWPTCDSVELFLDPMNTCANYIHLAAGADLTTYDARWKKKQETRWTVTSKITGNQWRLTFRLPFSDPGMHRPKTGDAWGFNICRNVIQTQATRYFSTWALVGAAFHRPALFGKLIFGTPESAHKAMTLKLKEELDKLTAELQKKQLLKEFKHSLQQLEQRCDEAAIRDLKDEVRMVEQLRRIR